MFTRHNGYRQTLIAYLCVGSPALTHITIAHALHPRNVAKGYQACCSPYASKQAEVSILQADDQEFMDWEHKTAIKRSEGTFFQNLYRIKKELPGAQAAAAVNTEVRPALLSCMLSLSHMPLSLCSALVGSAKSAHALACPQFVQVIKLLYKIVSSSMCHMSHVMTSAVFT